MKFSPWILSVNRSTFRLHRVLTELSTQISANWSVTILPQFIIRWSVVWAISNLWYCNIYRKGNVETNHFVVVNYGIKITCLVAKWQQLPFYHKENVVAWEIFVCQKNRLFWGNLYHFITDLASKSSNILWQNSKNVLCSEPTGTREPCFFDMGLVSYCFVCAAYARLCLKGRRTWLIVEPDMTYSRTTGRVKRTVS